MLTNEQQQRLFIKEQEGVKRGQLHLITTTIKPILHQTQMNRSKVRIIAHLLFDGWVDKKNRRVTFTCSSPKVIQQFINDVELVYGLKTFSVIQENDKGCQSLTYSSILMGRDLRQFTDSYSCKEDNIHVPQIIMDGSNDFKREFLRCFWADEGSIYIGNGRIDLIGTQTNIQFLWQIAHLHDNFGIKYHINEKEYRIVIGRKLEIRNFCRRIGFLEGSLVTKGKYTGQDRNDLLARILGIKDVTLDIVQG
jgi:hypothetical protein